MGATMTRNQFLYAHVFAEYCGHAWGLACAHDVVLHAEEPQARDAADALMAGLEADAVSLEVVRELVRLWRARGHVAAADVPEPSFVDGAIVSIRPGELWWAVDPEGCLCLLVVRDNVILIDVNVTNDGVDVNVDYEKAKPEDFCDILSVWSILRFPSLPRQEIVSRMKGGTGYPIAREVGDRFFRRWLGASKNPNKRGNFH